MIEKVKCLLCISEKGFSEEYSQLNNMHFKYKHNITIEEYQKEFPDAKLYGKDFSKKLSGNAKRTHILHPDLAKNNVKYLQKGQRKWLDAGNRSTDFHKENCNCVSCRAKRGENILNLHKLNCQCIVCCIKRGEDISKKFPNSCGDGKRFEKWRKENPEKAKKVYSTTMIKLRKERPEIIEKANKRSSERLKKLHEEERERNPEKFYNRYKKMSEQAKKNPEHSKKGGINCHKLHPNQAYENAIKAHKTIRENKPYVWEDTNFMSQEEMECAKLLLTKPSIGINCHIKIKHATIDFYPQSTDRMFQGKLVEYHSWDREMTLEEYKKSREEKISNSHLAGKELILIVSLSPMKVL